MVDLQNKVMAMIWGNQVAAIDREIAALPVDEAGAEYDAEILVMAVVERVGAAVPVGALVSLA